MAVSLIKPLAKFHRIHGPSCFCAGPTCGGLRVARDSVGTLRVISVELCKFRNNWTRTPMLWFYDGNLIP